MEGSRISSVTAKCDDTRRKTKGEKQLSIKLLTLQARKLGEQNGFDTHVVLDVNVEY